MKGPTVLSRDKYGGPWNLLKVVATGLERLEFVSARRTPFLHRLLFGKVSDCFKTRLLFGFILGAVVGHVFYELILVDLGFHRKTVYVLGGVFTIILSIGCGLSSQIRCITLLTIPSFCSKAGRHIVQAWIVSTIITGPVENMFCNIEEIMRMYTCSNSLAYNLSQARYDLLVKPFKIAFLGTKINTEELKDMLGSVKNVVEPFAQEIEGVDDVKFIQEENDYMDEKLNDTKRSEELNNKYASSAKLKKREDNENVNVTNLLFGNVKNSSEKEQLANTYQQQYFKKLETRCENVKTTMGKMCKKRFAKFKDDCEDAVHWSVSWIVCSPMQLDVICDVVKIFTYGDYDCDPSQVVSGEIGQGYVKLMGAGQTMQESVAEERIQYKLVEPPNFVGLYSIVTITKEFTHEIKVKKTYADTLISVLRTVLAFMFILVIHSAAKYHSDYIKFLSNDNLYVTANFRILDAKRHKLKKPTVLPLTKLEKSRLVDPYDLIMGKPEITAWMIDFWVILTMVIVVTVVVFIDKTLADGLRWMNENLEFSYTETGSHSFHVEVKGIGFVANIVRSIIKGFDFKKTLKGVVSNKHCLPDPKYLSKYVYFKLYSLCIGLVLMGLVGSYFRRLRRAICAYYYPEQEKRRVESLYKKTLSYRKRLFERQIELLYNKTTKIEIQSDLKLLWKLQQRYPWCLVLRIIPSTRPSCAICEENEALFHYCSPPYQRCLECNTFYCLECWTNFSYTCYICTASNRITEDKK